MGEGDREQADGDVGHRDSADRPRCVYGGAKEFNRADDDDADGEAVDDLFEDQRALASDYASDFIMHEMSASDALIEANPDAIRRFVKAWFEAADYMRTHKAETVAAAMPVTNLSAEDESQEYDLLMPEITGDGKHEPAMMQRAAESFVELKLLDQKPDLEKFYTNKFLP